MGRLSCIIGVGPRYHRMYPTHRRTGGNVTTEAQTGMIGPQAKECWLLLERWKRQMIDSPPGPLKEAKTYQHLDFSPVKLIWKLWPSELSENKCMLF